MPVMKFFSISVCLMFSCSGEAGIMSLLPFIGIPSMTAILSQNGQYRWASA